MESENRAPGERPMSPGANVDLPLANPGTTTAPAAYSAICNTLAMVQSQIKVLGRAILDDQDQSIELSRQRKSMTAKVIELAEEKIKTVERFNAVLDQVAILRQSKNTEAEELMAEAERQIALQWEKFNLEKEAAETKFQENTSKIENDLAELNRLRAEVQQTTAEREEFKELQRKFENAENAFKGQDMILKHNQQVYAQNLKKKDAIIENNQRASAQLLNEKNDALCQLKEVTLSDTKLKDKVVELEEKLQNMSVGSLEEEILRSKLQEAEKFKREWDDFMSRPQKTVDKNGVVRSSVVPNLKARKREVLEILRRSHPNDPILAVYISRLDDTQKSEYLPFDCFRNYSDPKIQEIAILGRNKKKPVSFALAHLAARFVVLEHRQVGLLGMQHIKFYNDQDKNGRLAIMQRLVEYYNTRFHYQIKILTGTTIQYDSLIVLGGNEDTLELEHDFDVGPYAYPALLNLNKQTYESLNK